MVGARGHRDRPADGRARRLDREHRAAVGPARTSASATPTGSGSSRPTRWRSAGCCCSVAASPTTSGRKRTFIVGLLGFAGASALGGIAPTAELLFAARALQGAFAALLAPAALSLITVTFTEPRERARAFGVFGADLRRRRGDRPDRSAASSPSTRPGAGASASTSRSRVVAAVGGRRGRQREQGARQHQLRHPRRGAGHRSAWSRWSTASPRRPSRGRRLDRRRPRSVFLAARRWSCWSRSWSGRRGSRNPLLPLRIVLDRNRGGVVHRSSCSSAPGCSAMFLFLTYYFQINLGYSPLKAGLRVPAVQRRHHPQRRAGRRSCCRGSARSR